MALAVILAFPIAGQAIVRHGSERIVWVGGIACALAVNLPVLAPDAAARRARAVRARRRRARRMDVSMNSHGVSVEKDLGRPIMSSLHAGWAFGGMAGAAFAAALRRARASTRGSRSRSPPRCCSRCSSRPRSRIGHGSAAEGEETPGFALPSRGVVLLAVLCLLVMVTEGAMADWGGLYLRQDLGASAALAALAYSFFTAGMTVGRVVGDWINRRIGAVALLRWGALLTGIPLAAMLLIGAAGRGAGRPVPGRPRRRQRRAADVQRRRPPARHAARRRASPPCRRWARSASSPGRRSSASLADAISLPWALATLIVGRRRRVRARAPRDRAHRARAADPTARPREPVAVP